MKQEQNIIDKKAVFAFDFKLFKKDKLFNRGFVSIESFSIDKEVDTLLFERVEEFVEASIIDKGYVTTYAGIFCAVYHNSILYAIIAYHPSFRYEILRSSKDTNAFIKDIAPGLKL